MSADAAKVVFLPMCADIIHVGHVNILNAAAAHGAVVVLLMTDDAMRSYKRAPLMAFAERETILRAMRNVSDVLPCEGPHRYEHMCVEHKPHAFVHGSDWKVGPQAGARARVIEVMASWDGLVVEPAYTQGVSSTQLRHDIMRTMGEKNASA